MTQKTIVSKKEELSRLNSRLNAATRRHKLLKNTRDGLTKKLAEFSDTARNLRLRIDSGLAAANTAMSCVRAVMSPAALEQALLSPAHWVGLEVTFRDFMTASIPEYRLEPEPGDTRYPYAYAQTSGELDEAVASFERVLKDMLKLAQCEKSMQLLTVEIEKANHGISLLECAVIPPLRASAAHASAKLEERHEFSRARAVRF